MYQTRKGLKLCLEEYQRKNQSQNFEQTKRWNSITKDTNECGFSLKIENL